MHRFQVAIVVSVIAICQAAGLAQDRRRDRSVVQDTQPVQDDGAIDFQRAREILQKRNRGEKLAPDEESYLRRAMEARQRTSGGQRSAGRDDRVLGPAESVGLKPLDEMTADDRYLDQDGGLYGGGSNQPPVAHRDAAFRQLEKIRPRDVTGKPSDDGKIVLVSISMSNATQEFSRFKQIADADPDKSSRLTIVDCAQGGQAMAEWVSPEAGPWIEAMRRVERAGVSPNQVQVAWVKLANKAPRGDLMTHGRKLQRDTAAVIENAKAKFPNLGVIYLSSRIYGGYSAGALNPEPYAYESAFVVRWLIEDQIEAHAAVRTTGDGAPARLDAPVLLWGPYLWADGTQPRRSDGLIWKRDDLGGDGTHPSQSGRDKVARMLLSFFKQDPLASSWYLGVPVRDNP